jgi:hypothetical protein
MAAFALSKNEKRRKGNSPLKLDLLPAGPFPQIGGNGGGKGLIADKLAVEECQYRKCEKIGQKCATDEETDKIDGNEGTFYVREEGS